MRRLARLALALLLLAAALATVLHGYVRGWHVEAHEPAALSALLRPYDEVWLPPGDGPFPTVLQFHGCGGKRRNQRAWAELFRDSGFAAVVVDSYAGRGLDWRDVCRGRHLLASERAGDVWVSLADARRLPFVDADRIVLAGWSHGGWSIMELLAMDPGREIPPNLASPPGSDVPDVAGVLLFYPYCGFPSRDAAWSLKPATLFLLAGSDSVAPPGDCAHYAATLGRLDVPVSTRLYPGAGHGFDQWARDGDGPVDGRTTSAARDHVRAFLASLSAAAARNPAFRYSRRVPTPATPR